MDCKHCGKSHREATPKQERFVREYLIDHNAKAAAKRAEYSPKTAEQIGYELLQKTSVACKLQQLKAKQAKRLDYSADRVLTELARVALIDVGKLFDEDGHLLPLKDMPEDARRAISSFEVETVSPKNGEEFVRISKVKLWSKDRTLEMLGKHHKLFTDVVQHQGELTLRERLAAGRRRAGKADE